MQAANAETRHGLDEACRHDLTELGWDAAWEAAFRPHEAERSRSCPHCHRVQSHLSRRRRLGDVQVQLAAARAAAGANCRRWATGWGCGWPPTREPGTIEAMLAPGDHFPRKVAGEVTAEQVVAADTAFMVMGLDGDFNPRPGTVGWSPTTVAPARSCCSARRSGRRWRRGGHGDPVAPRGHARARDERSRTRDPSTSSIAPVGPGKTARCWWCMGGR